MHFTVKTSDSNSTSKSLIQTTDKDLQGIIYLALQGNLIVYAVCLNGYYLTEYNNIILFEYFSVKIHHIVYLRNKISERVKSKEISY